MQTQSIISPIFLLGRLLQNHIYVGFSRSPKETIPGSFTFGFLVPNQIMRSRLRSMPFFLCKYCANQTARAWSCILESVRVFTMVSESPSACANLQNCLLY